MKVVMINGQNHKGSTYHLGKMFIDHLEGEQEVTEFFLPHDLNHFCLGCYQCVEHVEKCPFYEEKKVILDAMEAADLFVITSPNYCMGPSAALKAMIDLFFDIWMVHRPLESMFSKKAVIFSTSAGASTGSVTKMIKRALTHWGVSYIKHYGTSVQAMNWESVKDKKKEKIEKKISHLSHKVDCKKKVHASIKVKCIFKVMGMMHKAGWDSSPVEQEYWKEHGWLGKQRPWKR